MKTLFRSRAKRALVLLGCMLAVFLTPAIGAPASCDDIAKDVRQAVAKDPSKVLMIVEDALVISEECACEIVKAAIIASNADAAKVKEIVQTAMAVAPKKSAIIAECAAAVTSSGPVIAASTAETKEADDGKNPVSGKNVLAGKNTVSAKNVAPPVVAETSPVLPPEEGPGTEFSGTPVSIRGIYLVQPAAAGFLTIDESCICPEDEHDDGGHEHEQANSRRKRNLIDISPTYAAVK